jgi:hypothetical protein
MSTKKPTDEPPSPTDLAQQAAALLALATWEGDVPDEVSCACVAQAADLFRTLVVVDRATYLPHLARATAALVRHPAVKPDHRVTLGMEAVRLFRELSAQSPDAFRAELARSLDVLSVNLSRDGHEAAALAPAVEAVDLYRELAAKDPSEFLCYLSCALQHAALLHYEMGLPEIAIEFAEEELPVDRALAKAEPDAFDISLGEHLALLAAWRLGRGDHERALAAAAEAVAIQRWATEGSDELAFLLVDALETLARCLGAARLHADAAACRREARAVKRRCVGT